MAIIENNLVKFDKLVSIDGGTLVVNLGDKKQKVGPTRIMLVLLGTICALYYYSVSGQFLLALFFWAFFIGAALFRDLDAMANYRFS